MNIDIYMIRKYAIIVAASLLFIVSGSGKFSIDWFVTNEIEKINNDEIIHEYIYSETDNERFKWWR